MADLDELVYYAKGCAKEMLDACPAMRDDCTGGKYRYLWVVAGTGTPGVKGNDALLRFNHSKVGGAYDVGYHSGRRILTLGSVPMVLPPPYLSVVFRWHVYGAAN